MSAEIRTITPETESYDVRNAAIAACQRMPDGPDREAVRELFERFSDYLGLQSGGIPAEGDTKHAARIAELKTAIDFFMTISHTLSRLGLVTNWKQPAQEMAKSVYERVIEDRRKYRRTIKLIVEIYSVHLGASGALFAIDALPDDIRTEVERELKARKLLHDD